MKNITRRQLLSATVTAIVSAPLLNLMSHSAKAEWGPCAIFPGKQVAGAGWCSAWVKRAG